MPLEIREMIIRVTVSEKKGGGMDEAELDRKLQELKIKVVKECMDKLSVKLQSVNER